MKNIHKILGTSVGVLALGFLPLAQAVPTLQISVDGGAITSVSSPTGLVSFTGTIGTWNFIVSSGTTKPANGSATAAEMHVNIIGNSTSVAPTTLLVRFSETDFGPVQGTPFRVDSSSTVDASSGSFGNTVTHNTYFDSANALFGTTTLLATDTFLTGANSLNQFSAPQTDPNVYSLTGSIALTHVAGTGRSSSASLDIVQAVPDGGFTVTFLGIALLGLAAFRKSRLTA